MSSIDAGTTVWSGIGDQQWDDYVQDEFSYLGNHTNVGCAAAISVTAWPVATTDSMCLGEQLCFTHSSFGGTPGYVLLWDLGDGNTAVTDTVCHIYPSPGIYTVTLTITDQLSVVDDSIFTVEVLANPLPGFSTNEPICSNDTLVITSIASGSTISYAYSYDPELSLINENLTTGDASLTAIDSGSMWVTQVVTDMYGCIDSVTNMVMVNLWEDPSYGSAAICDEDTLLMMHSVPTGTWSGVGVTDLGSGSGSFSAVGAGGSGMHAVTYTISGLCPASYTDSMEVYDLPSASFTSSQPAGTTAMFDFADASSGNVVSWMWDFGDGTGTSTSQNPSYDYGSGTATYTVCLTVITADGCTDTFCDSISFVGVGISEINVQNINIYPNPSVDGMVTLDLSGKAYIEITNLIGQVLYSNNINGKSTMDLSSYVAGSYFVTAESNGNRVTKKLILK
jgi:PKD repeat protein